MTPKPTHTAGSRPQQQAHSHDQGAGFLAGPGRQLATRPLTLALTLAACLQPLPAQAEPSPKAAPTTPEPALLRELRRSTKALCSKLEPGSCVVLPPQVPAEHSPPWRLASHLDDLLQKNLEQCGFNLKSAEPFTKDLKLRESRRKKRRRPRSVWPSDPHAPPSFRPGSTLIGRAAKLSAAAWVLTCTCRLSKQQSRIELRLYEASTRRRKATETLKLPTAELSQEQNTPQTNQRLIDWVRARRGKKIGRGECWDLADQAVRELGLQRPGLSIWGRLLPKGAAYFPGDIIQWRKQESGRLHTAVIDGSYAPGHPRVLHQNWAGGKERGRKVGPGEYKPADLARARIYRPLPPEARKN